MRNKNELAPNPFDIMKAWAVKQRPHEMWITIQYADGRVETRAISRQDWLKLPKIEPTSIDDFAKWNPNTEEV